MSATVFGTARFGLASESSSTGLFAANISFAGTSEQAMAPNHIGQDVGMSIYNESIDVTIDGIIAVKGSGLVVGIADAVTLANTTDGFDKVTDILKTTPTSGASVIITAATISRSNTGFETGDLTGVYKPGFSAASPTTES
jgi:hypothetical protein